jgi:hypothetical protein
MSLVARYILSLDAAHVFLSDKVDQDGWVIITGVVSDTPLSMCNRVQMP